MTSANKFSLPSFHISAFLLPDMDGSSPLAAMRPSAPFGRRDIFHSHAHMSSNPLGPGPFHLREQLQRAQPDYFNVKSVRGSSPTASLAADMCQNFRIDNDTRCVRDQHPQTYGTCFANIWCSLAPLWPLRVAPYSPLRT